MTSVLRSECPPDHMSCAFRYVRRLFLLLFVLALPGLASAQQTITLQGRVATTDGSPLSDVEITVLNLETERARQTLTGATGSFTMVGLPPGRYRITAEVIGYATVERDIQLLLGQRPELAIQMREEAVEIQGLEVEVEATAFEVQRTDVSSAVVQEEIENLPLNTRNAVELASITPGIKSYAPVSGRSLPDAGALPSLRFWNFQLDGVEWKSMFNGNLVGIPQTGSPIPQEAIREFRVQLNPYDAEYTRGAAYIINAVTHRGTNEFEGSGFVYHQDNGLRALSHFQEEAKAEDPSSFDRADYDRQQLGFNLRGPILTDRLFFSASYELNNTTNAIDVVPGEPSFDPDYWDEYAGSFSAPTKNHTMMLRLTAPAGENHTLDAIWAGREYNSETSFGGTRSRQAGITADYSVHSVQLRDTYTPTSSLVNEASLHMLYWFHDEAPIRPGPQLNYPGIQIGRSGFPLELTETVWKFVDKLTYTPQGSNHLLKGGVEIGRVNTESFLPFAKDGVFLFETDTSSLPFRAIIGAGFNNPGTTEDALVEMDGWLLGAYVQDEWQALDNLTLSFGLRYDAEINTLNNDFVSPWADNTELQQKVGDYLNDGDRENDLNNVSPRVAFSWDPFQNRRTFFRGGFGIVYDRVAGFLPFFEDLFASWRTFTFEDPGTTDPDVLRERVEAGQGELGTTNLTLMKTRMETPQSRQFSIGVGHTFSPRFSMNVDYVDRRTSHVYVSRSLNPFIPSQDQRRLTQNFGNITAYDDIGDTKFQSIVTDLLYDDDRYRLRAAYTLAWYRAEFEGLGGFTDLSFFDMQPTSGDERHRLVLSGVAQLPYGIRASGIGTFASPTPFGVTIGEDLNDNGSFGDDWPNGKRVQRPDGAWENWYRTVDLRLAKDFRAPGGTTATVSAEVFNVFDWDNWTGFFGRMRDAEGSSIDNFGEPSGVYAPRQAQIGVRFGF